MRKAIYLIRHAESEITVDPLKIKASDILTAKGTQEAHAIACRCKELRVDAIYTSKTPRAQHTAREIGVVIGKEPVAEDVFKERKVRYTDSKKYEYLETFEELKARLFIAKQFLENFPGGCVVIVSHALFIRALTAYLTFSDGLTEEMLESITRVTIIENGSLSKVTYDTEQIKWHIVSLNDTSHLSKS